MARTRTIEAKELALVDERQAPSEQALQVIANPTPAQMLMVAVQRGDAIDRQQQLMQLQREWEAGEARKAFVAAMARFKSDPPTIVKDKKVGYENRDGTFTGYTHATLAEVTSKIAAGLGRVGISHSWDVQHEGGLIIVSCTLTHEMGHSQTITMPPVAPDDSGKKNRIQQVASAITYVQRYSLLAITGLAAKDQDDDGRAGGGEWKGITPEQVQQLEDEVRRLGADRANFLRYLRCDTFADIAAENFQTVMDNLRAKKAGAGGKGGTAPPQRKSDQPQQRAPEVLRGKSAAADMSHADKVAELRAFLDKLGMPEKEVLRRYELEVLEDATFEQLADAHAWLAGVPF